MLPRPLRDGFRRVGHTPQDRSDSGIDRDPVRGIQSVASDLPGWPPSPENESADNDVRRPDQVLATETPLLKRRKSYDGKRVKGMAILDWSQCPAVESVPGRLSSAWVFKNAVLREPGSWSHHRRDH